VRAQEGWRLPAAYRYTTNLDGQDLAWEFLRRNDRFREELSASPAAAQPAEPTGQAPPRTRSAKSGSVPWRARRDPVAQWGLTFRPEPRAAGGRDRGDLLTA